jgi:hypothetical protein
MTKSSAKLLNDVIASLVEAYGADIVREAVARADRKNPDNASPPSQRGSSPASDIQSDRRHRIQRPTAADLIRQYPVSSTKKQYVDAIAERFDRKQFLPSSADAREFLILSGEKPGSIKDRSDAFKQILTVLVRLPEKRLEDIATSAAHSGPSQLSAISDAIGTIGQENRQRRETS